MVVAFAPLRFFITRPNASYTFSVIEDDTEPKVPLTAEQEESLLSFMQGDSVYQKYYDEVIILLGTGIGVVPYISPVACLFCVKLADRHFLTDCVYPVVKEKDSEIEP